MPLGDTLLLTMDSLIHPVTINRSGDKIIICEPSYKIEADEYDYYIDGFSVGISFGDAPNAMCGAPAKGQSLAFEYLQQGHPEGFYEMSMLCLEDSVSLGSNLMHCKSRTCFKGYLVDKNDNPIPNAEFQYISSYFEFPVIKTNSAGYFECNSMYATRYRANVLGLKNYTTTLDFTLDMNTDSVYLFKLEEYDVTGVELTYAESSYSISCTPNPASHTVCLVTTTPSTVVNKPAFIRIYDMDGKMVKIVTVDTTSATDKVETNWAINGHIPNGEYICCLTVDGQKVATAKLIIAAK